MNRLFGKIKSFFKTACDRAETAISKRPFVCCAVMSVLVTVLTYVFHARSVIGGFAHILSGVFGFFFVNVLIYLTLYSLSLFFHHRMFAIVLVSFLGIALGLTNGVIMAIRNVPLFFVDFYIFFTGPQIIMFGYLSLFEIILVALGVLACIVLLVILFVKSPKCKPNYKKASLTFLSCALALLFLWVGSAGADKKNDSEITPERYGYTYFFVRGIFDRGIPEPEDYSVKSVMDVINELSVREDNVPEKKPDIIMIQLESVFDVNRASDFDYSKNPMPNFTALCEKYPSGLFRVPAFGSGTANTEFEVLSGINHGFFGVGEYPYLTVLENGCCETIAYNLKEIGYSAHAFHNHTATFYNRVDVYSRLGFDDFTAREHMVDVEENSRGWAKDKILTKYILKALDSTEGSDFVFAVSVQGHGGYPTDPYDEIGKISVDGIDEEKRKNEFEYYVNQINEIDEFIGELYNALNARGKDFVLVLYGDHLPAMLDESDVENDGMYNTDYVIVSNLELDIEDRDIEAYELSPIVLDAIGVSNGLVNKVHSEYRDGQKKKFEEALQLVAYDILYGDRIAYNGGNPYRATDMIIGIDPITVTGVESFGEGYKIFGENFTPDSCVFVNGERLNTEYIDRNSLYIDLDYSELFNGDEITVAQISGMYNVLSKSEAFVYTNSSK